MYVYVTRLFQEENDIFFNIMDVKNCGNKNAVKKILIPSVRYIFSTNISMCTREVNETVACLK